MRTYDSNTIAALSKASTIQRVFLYVRGKDSGGSPVNFGFWNGVGDVSVSVVSAIDGATESRTYIGGGSLIKVPALPLRIGLEARTIEVTLSQIHTSVRDMVYGNNIRHAVTEIHRGYFDTETGQIVSTPYARWLGKINGAPEEIPAAGGEGSIKLRIASNTRDLTLTNPAKKSDESQRLRSDDRFRRFTGVAGRVGVWWGESQRES